MTERLPANEAGSLLAAGGLVKSFGETRALTDGNLSVAPGEVVAVMGENGSGKSTIVKILTGVLRPDAGTVWLDGRSVRLRSPKEALDNGIVTVFQEILVAPALHAADNVCLGNRRLQDTRASRAERRSLAEELLNRLRPGGWDLDAPVGSLRLMEQQICVIARAIARQPKVLILDEATSTLDVTVRDRLFAVVREMCARGTGVFFISHRMDEVMSLADRITVLRSGQTVGTIDAPSADPDSLVKMMSGESVAIERGRRDRQVRRDAPPILSASGVRVFSDADPIDVQVAGGEIVGLAGLEGQGQEEFLRALAGLDAPLEGKIEHHIEDSPAPIRSYRHAVRDGIVYIPRDRKVEGLAGGLSVVDNFAMPTYERDGRPLFSYRRTLSRLDNFRQRLALTAPAKRPAGRLSGGNQQKVVLARWLAVKPKVVLLNDPTRGVDHATKHEIYDLLEELASTGVGVVMVSTEVEEHLALMDRTLVFRRGSVTAEYPHGAVDRDGLVAAFFGHTRQPGATGGTAE